MLSKSTLYYVLSKVFMTEKGDNVADLLSDAVKELHAMNVKLTSIDRKLSSHK